MGYKLLWIETTQTIAILWRKNDKCDLLLEERKVSIDVVTFAHA
jgi:hypothetical protein